MSQSYRVTCLSEAAAPITHMASTSGNEALIAREPVVTARGVQLVPMLSGNAIRHRMIREPGALWLIGSYELRGKLSLPQLNFLLHGGNLTDGGGMEDTRRIADMQRLFPLLRLLGGCLPDQVLAGSLLVGRGTLVCEENRATLGTILGAQAPGLPERMRAAETFIAGYQYTRGDARKSGLAPPETNGDGETNLMIFAGQQVTRGAAFVHDFFLPNVSLVELGALLLSLQLWRDSGGTIGGQGARGHGRLETAIICPDFDQAEAVAAYRAHAAEHKDEAANWLNSVFAAKAERAAKKAEKKVAAPKKPEPAEKGLFAE